MTIGGNLSVRINGIHVDLQADEERLQTIEWLIL